jgi:hypothetical protein
MSGYADRYDGPDDREPLPAGTAIDRARSRVAAPAILMILNGLLGIALWVGLTGLTVANPLWQIEALRKFLAGQPASQEKQDAEKKLQEAEDAIKADPAAVQMGAALRGGGLILLNAIAVFGAIRMRSLGSYTWGVVASVLSLIPIVTGCVCTGMPFGIWGLVVLLNQDVKAGFAAARAARQSPPPDAY